MPIPSEFTDEEITEFSGQGQQIGDEAARTTAVPVTEPTVVEPVVEPSVETTVRVEPVAADPAPVKMVPHEALHAERLRTQEANRTAALATARMNALLASQRGTEPAAMPSLEDDPAGYIEALHTRLAAFENQRTEDTQNRTLDTAVEQDERTFTSYTPDYPQASEYYVQSRGRELLQFHPPQEAQRILTEEVRQIAQRSWEQGVPAAEGIYKLAQARGYRTGQPSPFATTTTAVDPAGGGAKPAVALTPAAVVAAAAAGQLASKTLSTATGAAAPTALNAEALLAMTDEEFEAHLKLGTKGANKNFANIGAA